jgi:hypothetical protein
MKISISEIGDKKKIIRQMLKIYFSQELLAQLVEKNMRDDFALLMETETIKSLEKYPIEKKGNCVYDPNSAIKNRFCGIFFDVVKEMPSPMQNTSEAERKFIYAFPDEINIPKDELGGKIITVTHLYAGPLKKKYPRRLIKKHELARRFFSDKENFFIKSLAVSAREKRR